MPHKKPYRILIVSTAFYDTLDSVNTKKYLRLAPEVEGDLTGTTAEKTYTNCSVGSFAIHATYLPPRLFNIKLLKTFYFIFHTWLKALYRHFFVARYDVIIAREPQFSGLIAVMIKWFIRRPLITELNGNYASPLVWDDIRSPWVRRLKRKLSLKIIPFVLSRSQAIKLLYPTQADPYNFRKNAIIETFHEYTPIQGKTPPIEEDKTILSMGFPSTIKGFDVLVKAFNQISDQIPDWKLNIIGYMTAEDRSMLDALRNGNNRISFLKPLDYSDAQKEIASCGLFVLASRTEGMGRVLLEAMAYGKAVVGSDADGIPHYVQDGVNGLTFPSGDETALAAALLKLTQQHSLREKLASDGFKLVHQHYSEEQYKKRYVDLINKVVS